MKKKFKFKIVLIILSCLTFLVNAQEVLKPLSFNAVLSNSKKTNALQSAKTQSLASVDLPFFDDFSYAYKSTYPSTTNWIDSNVYVNTGFAIAPLSIGVATFEGLNKHGYPYNISAPVNLSAPADVLTSRKINLKQKGAFVYGLSDSIALSFYYQAEGNGEAPEVGDSLAVDFYKKSDNSWNKVWGKAGYNPANSDSSFHRVVIFINDAAYLDSSFQFRFRNRATTSGSLDHWHIDYVGLNSGVNVADSNYNDINFAYKPSSFLRKYTVMPYNHYSSADLYSQFTNYFRSNYAVGINNNKDISYKYNLYNNYTNTLLSSKDLAQAENPGIKPYFGNGYLNDTILASPSLVGMHFPSPLLDTAEFKVEHIIYNTSNDFTFNDTVVHLQKFGNYFSHDDGSAEQGYYLNYFGAKTAVKYTLNVNDTLKAINIYFDPIINGQLIQSSSFRLMVWNDGGSSPSNIILKDSIMYPKYIQGSNNLFPTYKLTTCLVLPAGSYYFGLQQTSNVGLNIGFDKNTNHKNTLAYDIGNGWSSSTINGALMINPVMGCVDKVFVSAKENNINDTELNVFPNPAQTTITFSTNKTLKDATLTLTSLIGQTVFEVPFQNNQPLDVSHLIRGIYYATVTESNHAVVRKKIIITN